MYLNETEGDWDNLPRWSDQGKSQLQILGGNLAGQIGWPKKPDNWSQVADNKRQDYYLWCLQYYGAEVMQRDHQEGQEIYDAATQARSSLKAGNAADALNQVKAIQNVANTNRSFAKKFFGQLGLCLFSGVIPYLLTSFAAAVNNHRKHGTFSVPWWNTTSGYAARKAKNALEAPQPK